MTRLARALHVFANRALSIFSGFALDLLQGRMSEYTQMITKDVVVLGAVLVSHRGGCGFAVE